MTSASKPPYSIAEAARLLGISPKTVRRRLSDPSDDLEAAREPSRPVMVSFDSMQRARRRLADELELYLEPVVACDHPELDDLRRDNERLRRLAQTLRLAQSELLRNLGDFADPVMPDN